MAAPTSTIIPVPGIRKVVAPLNYGLFLDRPPALIPEGGMVSCRNVRIKNQRVTNRAMGWDKFMAQPLIGEVLLIDQFFLRDGSQNLIFGTKLDLYRYDEAGGAPLFITPIYATGTITTAVYNGGTGRTTLTGLGTLWNTASNIKVGDYYRGGSATEDDPADTWFAVHTITSDTVIEVTGDASAWSGGAAYTIRKTFTGDVYDRWDTEIFPDAQPDDEDLWFATNGISLVKWNGTDARVTVLSLGFSCQILTRHQNVMLYGNIIEAGEYRPQTIKSSAIGIPENVSTLEATQFEATDGVDTLLDLVSMGDFVVAYYERSINQIQYTGPPTYWLSRTSVPGIGPIAARALMDFGDYHEFIGPDAAYRYNGVGIEEVGSHVFREVLRTVSPNRRSHLISHIDEENGEVLWIVPLTSDLGESPEYAYVEHYLEGPKNHTPITVRDLPAMATGYFERADTLRFSDLTGPWTDYGFQWNDRFFDAAFPFNLFGDSNGYVYTLGTSDEQDGADFDSFARFARFPVGDGLRKGFVHRVEPFLIERTVADYSLGIVIYTADFMDGNLSLGGSQDFALAHSSPRRWCSYRVPGLYAEIQFQTTLKNQPWDLAGFAYSSRAMGIR